MADRVVAIDASNLILGRLASQVAKRLLENPGERVVIVNAEEAVVSGGRSSLLREAKAFLEVGGSRWGPRHPRGPDRMLRATIRGMLPRGKERGRDAYRRLRVYVGFPERFRSAPTLSLPGASASQLGRRYIRLGELAKGLGWRP